MRITQLVGLWGIAGLVGCNEEQPVAPRSGSDRPSLAVYTAVANAPVTLGAYNGSSYTIPGGINDLGTISGESSPGTAVLWETGVTATPASTTAVRVAAGHGVHDINSAGQIVESSGLAAVLLTPDGAGYIRTDVGLAGAEFSNAAGLNDRGQVVGKSRFGSEDRCFVWTPIANNATTGIASEVPGLGGSFCSAEDINEAGQIVGSSSTAASGLPHAFVRSGGATIDLQPGSDLSYAAAINNAGQIVGTNMSAAAIWSPSAAGWTTAVDLIVPALSGQIGVISSMALDINDAGFVVGTTRDNDNVVRAYFWQGSTFTELTDPSSTIVSPSALTNVLGNIVVVVGLNLEAVGTNRKGLRWAVSLEPAVPVGYLDQLIQLINDLESGGRLNAAEVVSLRAKVEAATRQIAQGGPRTDAEKNVLTALIKSVQALRASGRITTAEAQALIDAAEGAIAQL